MHGHGQSDRQFEITVKFRRFVNRYDDHQLTVKNMPPRPGARWRPAAPGNPSSSSSSNCPCGLWSLEGSEIPPHHHPQWQFSMAFKSKFA